MPDLRRRELLGELMDQPGLPAELHHHALAALRRINRLSLTARSVARAVARLTAARADRPISVLDIACGGGDVTLGLARYAKRRNLPWSVTGCDISPTAIDHATAAARRAGIDARFVLADALAGLPGAYDVVTCTLFLHHLPDDPIVTLLQQAARARHVVISDLRRGAYPYAMTWLGTRLITTSPIVHVDGPLSVRAALTPPELGALAERAGMRGAAVRRCFPMRMLLTWSGESGESRA